MAGERINNPATKWRTKCNGFALLFWEQEERFDSDVFHQPYDMASVHVVALLSSIVLGITQNCPLGYSAIAKRLRQWSLTPSLVCSNHTRATKAHNGRSCKSSYKVAVKQLCGSGENHGAVAAFSLKFVLDNHIILW